MKVTIEVDLSDEDLKAGHHAFLSDGGEMTPDDMVQYHLQPAVDRTLHRLRSKMKWNKGGFEHLPRMMETVRGRLLPVQVLRPVEGSWKCPDSPTGVCWYCDDTDAIRDHCVFCGEPNERK